jgi:uncharacterized protein YukE
MSDFGTLSYDFGSIDDHGTGLKSEAMNITSALEDLEQQFRNFIASHWQNGNGTEAFQHIQNNWRQQSDDLTARLLQLGTHTVSAGDAMNTTDGLVAKLFD